MLGLGERLLFLNSESPPELSFLGSATSASNSGSYNLGTLSLGAEAADRKIIAAVTAIDTALISGVLLNGAGMALVERAVAGGRSVAIFHMDIPTGTSAPFTVTPGSSSDGASIALWRMTGQRFSAAQRTFQQAIVTTDFESGTVSPDPLTFAVNTGKGEVGIIAVARGLQNIDSWVNASQTYSATIDSPEGAHSGGYFGPEVANVQLDFAAFSDAMVLAAVWK